MKLVIQIPCFNEQQTLPQTIRDLPKSIPGIDQIEILVVDDGSTDRTVEVARLCGAHHILSLGTNRGLGRAFAMGLEQAVLLHADIVVNTDGDNQYVGADIAKLVEPILQHRADMVVGCRPIVNHPEFSPLKKRCNCSAAGPCGCFPIRTCATRRPVSARFPRKLASGW